jgi:hypothetical protein
MCVRDFIHVCDRHADNRSQQRPSQAKAKAHAAALIRRIGAAHRAGKFKRADALTLVYLNSLDAKYAAVHVAYKSLKPHRRPDPQLLFSYAQALDPWQGTQEDVFLTLKEKPAGPDGNSGHFGLRGTHAAIKRAAELLADGHTWAIKIDIANCYPSFDGEKVTV